MSAYLAQSLILVPSLVCLVFAAMAFGRLIYRKGYEAGKDDGYTAGIAEGHKRARLIPIQPKLLSMLNRAVSIITFEWGYETERAINWLTDETGNSWCEKEAPDISEQIISAISKNDPQVSEDAPFHKLPGFCPLAAVGDYLDDESVDIDSRRRLADQIASACDAWASENRPRKQSVD